MGQIICSHDEMGTDNDVICNSVIMRHRPLQEDPGPKLMETLASYSGVGWHG